MKVDFSNGRLTSQYIFLQTFIRTLPNSKLRDVPLVASKKVTISVLFLPYPREVHVYKRTVTTHVYSLLQIWRNMTSIAPPFFTDHILAIIDRVNFKPSRYVSLFKN